LTPTLSALADTDLFSRDLASLGHPAVLGLLSLGFLLIAGLLAAAGTALISLRRHRAESRETGGVLDLFLTDPRHTVSAAEVSKTAAEIAATLALGGTLIVGLPGLSMGQHIALTAGVGALLIAVLGEILPRRLAARSPETTLRMVVRPIALLLWPIVQLQRIFHRRPEEYGRRNDPEEPLLEEMEQEALVAMSGPEVTLDEDEREMVEGVLDFGRTSAQDIMTPRTEVRTVSHTDSAQRVSEAFEEISHSRMLVCGDSPDQVIGFLHRKEFLLYPERSWLDLIREPLTIPPTMELGELLGRFRGRRIFLAVVVDEYGGTAGIVTLKDVLEAIVGEIEEESANGEGGQANGAPAEPIRRDSDHGWVVWGRVEIWEFNERVHASLPENRARTVSGFVVNTLGHIPQEGEALVSDGWRFQVKRMAGPRIEEIRLEPAQGQNRGPRTERVSA
jgi:CBS domain containing-hemolysin-like protein